MNDFVPSTSCWRLAPVWKLLARSGVNAGEILQRLVGVNVQREREQQGTDYWPVWLSKLRDRSVSS